MKIVDYILVQHDFCNNPSWSRRYLMRRPLALISVGLNRLNNAFLAELLHAEGAHVEPNTLENLVTYQSKRQFVVMWLAIRTYICMSICQYLKKIDSNTIIIATFLILGIHIMVNWQLSKWAIRWLVLHEHIAGSGLELMGLCFFEVGLCPGTGFFRLHLGSSLVITHGEKEGVCAKAKCQRKINAWWIVDFSSDISCMY